MGDPLLGWLAAAFVFVLIVVAVLFLLPWKRHAVVDFAVPFPIEAVHAEAIRLAYERQGWRARAGTYPYYVKIRCLPTFVTYAKRIEIWLSPISPHETRVVATSRSPQLVDWGEGRRALAEVHRRLLPPMPTW